MPSLPAKDSDIDYAAPQGGEVQAPRDAASPDPAQAPTPAHADAMARFNEAGVRNAQANWLDGMNALLYAPGSGYFNQSGAAAMGGYAPVQDALGKLYQQAQDGLPNDTQRGMFASVTAPLLDAFQARIHQHAQAQGRVYDGDASRARALSARDLAINAWNPAPGADNSNYRQLAAILHNELENQFHHAWGEPGEGDNPALWDHYLQHGPNGDDGMASLSTGIVNRLLASGQPHDAQAFLDQTRDTLPAPTRDKLGQFVTAALDQHAGMSAALQAQAVGNDPASNDSGGNGPGGNDLAAQQHKLDALRDQGHLSNEAHAIASHKIQADQAATLATRQQNDTQTLQRVWDLKNANPNAALTDLSSADYAYLKSRGLDGNALAILQSHPATDDPALFNQLHRQATQDPVQFGKANLLAQSGKLSRAHMQTLQNLQDAINKQDPQAMQAGRQINMTVNALMSGMPSIGVGDESAAPGVDIREKEDQAQKLEAGLRDHLIAAQQSDPKLTLQDLHASGAAFLKDWALYGDGSAARRDAQPAQGGSLPNPDAPQKPAGADGADHAPDGADTPAADNPAQQTKAQGGGANGKSPQAPGNFTLAGSDPHDTLAAGAPVAAGTTDEHSQHMPGDHESSADARQPGLSPDEFNKFAPLARLLEHRSNQAAKNKEKMTVTSDEKNQLLQMQQRLGIKQTGSFDNATRHALHAEFIELIRPAAEAEEKKTGIPAAITIGQAILETGYGLHIPTDVKTGLRSNNLFGIKAVKGQPAVNSWTHEYDKKGNLVSVVQPFAVYDSIGGSIPEHSAFLKKYRNYRSLFSSSDPEKWAQGLQDAGYGGKDNKKYAGALINTMRAWNLIK